MEAHKQSSQPNWFRRYKAWLLVFCVPFLVVGFLAGNGYYHHLEKDIGKNYSTYGKDPDYTSMLESAGVVFLACGAAAGLAGVAILAAGKGVYKLSKQLQF